MDARLAAERAVNGSGEIGEAARLAAAGVEKAAHLRMVVEEQHLGDAVADIDEIALLPAIRNAVAMRAEEVAGHAGLSAWKDLRGDALLAALVIFVGAIDVEEFEAGPLRRMRRAALDQPRHAAIEKLLRPAIGVKRSKLGKARRCAVIVETGAAIAIGRGRGGVDEARAGRRAPLPEHLRQREIVGDDEIGVGLGGRGGGTEMEDRIEAARLGGEEIFQCLGCDQSRELALAE